MAAVLMWVLGWSGGRAGTTWCVGGARVRVHLVDGGAAGQSIEHLRPRGVVVNLATPDPAQPVSFRPGLFDSSAGARIYTLNTFDELTAHASGTADLTRLAQLAATGRLDGHVELQASWRDASSTIKARLGRKFAGKAVLHVD